MKKYIAWIAVSLCVMLCTGLVFISHNKQKKIIQEAKRQVATANSELGGRLLAHLQYGNSFKLQDSLVIQNNNGLQQELKDISSNRPMLVLKIAEKHCSSCIESAIVNLSKSLPSLSRKVNIAVLISTHSSFNTLHALENSYQNKFRFYKVNKASFQNNKIEKLDVPYFFVVFKGRYLGYLFIPDMYRPKLTLQYFQLIEQQT